MITQSTLTQKQLSQRYLTQRLPLNLTGSYYRFFKPTGWWNYNNVETDLDGYVSKMIDLSGNGFHLIQNTQIYKPLLQPDGLKFDGINDFMRVSFGQTFTQPNTYIIVWNVTNYTGNSHHAFTGLDLTNRNAFVFNDVSKYMLIGAPTFVSLYQKTDSTFPFILNTCIFNSSASQLYENSIFKGEGNPSNAAITGLTIGGSTHTPVNNPLNGTISDILFYNRLLTSYERTFVENYLKLKKWNIK